MRAGAVIRSNTVYIFCNLVENTFKVAKKESAEMTAVSPQNITRLLRETNSYEQFERSVKSLENCISSDSP